MDAFMRFQCLVALGLTLTASSAPVLAQGNNPQESPSLDPAASLMSLIGRLKGPLLIAMNCPDAEKDKKSYIAKLARNNKDPESVAAFVIGSVALVQRMETAVDHGEENDGEPAESFQPEVARLTQLASSVQNSGGLSFASINFGYKANSLTNQMLSSISVLYAQQIPSYTNAIKFDPATANVLEAEIVEIRLSELTLGHPAAADENLTRTVRAEIEIGSLEWIAIRNIIAAGLDHLTLENGLSANFTQRTPDGEKRSEEEHRLISGGEKLDKGNYPAGYTPVTQSAKHERSRELQELEKTQADLARILAEEKKQLAAFPH